MAAFTLAILTSALTAVVAPMLNDQVNRSSVFLSLLDKEDAFGPNATWPVKGGSNSATVWADADTVDASAGTPDTPLNAVTQWAIYGDRVQVGDLAQAVAESIPAGHAAQAFQGKGALLLSHVKDACEKVAEKLNQHSYSATGTSGGKNTVVGLATLAKATGSYAGIDPTTYTWWKAIEQANGAVARNITKELVQTFFNTFIEKTNGGPGRKPDYAITTPALWLKLKQDIEADSGVQVNVSTEVPASGGKITIPAGCTAFLLDGTWVIQDPDCTAGTMYAWCRDALVLKTLPAVTTEDSAAQLQAVVKQITGSEVDMAALGAPASAMGRGTIKPHVKKLGATGLSTNLFVGCYVSLACKRRNAVGQLADLQ